MGKVLDALHRLQSVELRLAEIRSTRGAKLRRVETQRRQVKGSEDRLEESKLSVRRRQIRLDATQLEVATREEATDKHRQALNAAKTNKEYAAILTAMNTEKADTAKFETEILQLMEDIGSMNDEASQIEEERGKAEADLARAEKALAKFDADSKAERSALEAKRNECAEGLEPTILESFNRVAEHHDGEAMVALHRIHPKREDYVCGGCNITITLEVVNLLRCQDRIQTCKTCGRVLFIEAPEEKRAGVRSRT